MKLALTPEEYDFMSYLIEARRCQIKAIGPLWERHHRQDAKRILDGFPYDKGSLVPYLKGNRDAGALLWEPQTHNDLIADLRDHLAEQTNLAEPMFLEIVHQILTKMEALAPTAREETGED